MKKQVKNPRKAGPLFSLFLIFSIFLIFTIIMTAGATMDKLLLEREDVFRNEKGIKENSTTKEDFSYSFQEVESVDLSELPRRIKEEGVNRFFLSEVVIIDDLYTPKIHACLSDQNGMPLYSPYIYDFWSLLTYPEQMSPKIVLVRYRLLPEDNSSFQPNKSCYIKEIINEDDWMDVEKKYNFRKELF
jgi:hypothetical protein